MYSFIDDCPPWEAPNSTNHGSMCTSCYGASDTGERRTVSGRGRDQRHHNWSRDYLQAYVEAQVGNVPRFPSIPANSSDEANSKPCTLLTKVATHGNAETESIQKEIPSIQETISLESKPSITRQSPSYVTKEHLRSFYNIPQNKGKTRKTSKSQWSRASLTGAFANLVFDRRKTKKLLEQKQPKILQDLNSSRMKAGESGHPENVYLTSLNGPASSPVPARLQKHRGIHRFGMFGNYKVKTTSNTITNTSKHGGYYGKGLSRATSASRKSIGDTKLKGDRATSGKQQLVRNDDTITLLTERNLARHNRILSSNSQFYASGSKTITTSG